jgi:hypothetical protein
VRDEEEGHAPERPLLSIGSTLSMVTKGFIAAHNSRKKLPTNKRMTWEHYGALCRVSRALGKALNTLGKGFVECRTRQRVHDKKFVGKDIFVKCFLSGFAECHDSTR